VVVVVVVMMMILIIIIVTTWIPGLWLTMYIGAVPIGHHNYAKSQNEHIKRTSYLKNYSISWSFKILYYSKLMKPNDNSKFLISN
jgi:hypothetical protein